MQVQGLFGGLVAEPNDLTFHRLVEASEGRPDAELAVVRHVPGSVDCLGRARAQMFGEQPLRIRGLELSLGDVFAQAANAVWSEHGQLAWPIISRRHDLRQE